MTEQIFFARLREGAVIPSKRDEDAGYDVYACLETDYIKLDPMETRRIPTGIASACSSAFYFQVFERGSTGSIGMSRRCGVIDSGYRGEWFIPITNLNRLPLYIARPQLREHLEPQAIEGKLIAYFTSKAIAQVVLLPVPQTEIVELDHEALMKLPSERGLGSLGSSQK